jgi:hypothetical protein
MAFLSPLVALFTGGGAAAAGTAAGTGVSLGQTAALVGTGISALGTIAAGKHQQASLEFQQKQAEQQENEARAASQRDAEARRREGRLIQSRQRAAIAGSGGSIADASVLDLMADTAEATDLAARTDLYRGEQQARGYRDAAKVAGIDAKNAMSAAYLGAAGGLFSGVSNMYSRFGQQQKKTATAPAVALPYG